jgi:uncharacterized protein (TIGR02646 family)
MRPVSKGAHPTDPQGANVVFREHTDATPYLKERLGRYCSYCERKIPSSLAVEHIVPKVLAPDKALLWENFLLACATCNSTKGTKNPDVTACLWPHTDDTFSALSYAESGSVKPNPNFDAATQQKALALIQLVGLHKLHEGSDHRWDDRLEAWGKAKKIQALLLQKRDAKMLELLISVAKDSCWSIWMTVFKSDLEVQNSLVASFPGTRYTPTLQT